MTQTASGASSGGEGVARAAEAAKLSYLIGGYETSSVPIGSGPTWAGEALFVQALNRVECIVDASTHIDTVLDSIRSLSDDGWTIWAVVPQDQLGGAHRRFRQQVERVQGWWFDGDRVAFSAPEHP